jgi:phosphatidate phosphatase APP1
LSRSRRARPIAVVGYRSYGTADRVWVRARVLEGTQLGRAERGDSRWRNLTRTWRSVMSREVPGARVAVRFTGSRTEATADAEGFVRSWLVPAVRPPPARLWHEAEIDVLDPTPQRSAPRRAEVMIPSPAVPFGIVSDVDDTVVRTDVARPFRMAAAIALGNAYSRTPFPGVRAFFRALHLASAGPPRPIFYVSNGPWNLYDAFVHYLELQDIPPGPVELRDWGGLWDEARRSHRGEHKRAAIRRIFETFPTLPFVLIGDSSERDPEIYRELVHDFPHRVLAIYIRDVSPDPTRVKAIGALADEVTKAGSALVLADDTVVAARHAADHGWIDPASVDLVAEERSDAGKKPGETVIVEGGEERHVRA